MKPGDTLLPPEIEARLSAMLRERRTGTVQLNINHGRIETYEVRDHNRLHPPRGYDPESDNPMLAGARHPQVHPDRMDP